MNIDVDGNITLEYLIKPSDIKINEQSFESDMAHFKDTPFIDVSIRRHQKKRSNSLNRYMWGEVIPKIRFGMRQLGNRLTPGEVGQVIIDLLTNMSNEGVHEYLKERFAPQEEFDYDSGEVFKKNPSTKVMTNQQLIDYIEKIIKYAAEHLYIKIFWPNEKYQMPLDQWIEQAIAEQTL